MFVRLMIIVILAFVVFAGLRGALAKKNLTVNQFFAIYFVVMVGIALLFAAVTGRLHPVFALVGAVLPFLSNIVGLVLRGAQFASIIRTLSSMGMGIPTSGPANTPDSSEIRSAWLHMVLFHDTGMMDGTVLQGQFKNQKLSMLELPKLTSLLNECEADTDSYNLLLAYLDREHEGWQAAGGERSERAGQTDGPMTKDQALEILGLEGRPSRQEIVQAHRRLMQKMHPDRGGSTWLAAKINLAKDILMERVDD